MYIVGTVVEIVHSIVKPIYNFQPFLTRTELFQVAVTHTLNINKSRQDLGYQPIDHDIADIVKYYCMTGHGRKSSQASYWLVNVALMAIFAILILSFLPVVTT
ncbi:short-chain dehydrogenase/reductase family 42E member 1-like [Saccoglossus kowalevskii]